jgi:hypothetical protein
MSKMLAIILFGMIASGATAAPSLVTVAADTSMSVTGRAVIKDCIRYMFEFGDDNPIDYTLQPRWTKGALEVMTVTGDVNSAINAGKNITKARIETYLDNNLPVPDQGKYQVFAGGAATLEAMGFTREEPVE